MNKEKISKLFLIGVGIFLMGILLYRYLILLPQVDKYGKYTIGKVVEVQERSKGRMLDVTFIYSKDRNEFKNSTRVRNKKLKIIGNRFVVLYLSNRKNQAQILLEYPVPDSIKTAPPEGWKELPEWANRK